MEVIKRKHMITKTAKDELSEQCPRMKALIQYIGDVESYYIEDHFTSLCSSIVYQSISFKAATSIWNRFVDSVDAINPTTIIQLGQERLREIGLSNSKALYLLNIACAFNDKAINVDFNNMSNAEVKSELQKVKGIGPWTSEMFLIFSLYRKDILSYGDIAIRRGIEFLYKLDHDLTKNEFEYYKQLYQPNLTIASFYLWEITLRQLFNSSI